MPRLRCRQKTRNICPGSHWWQQCKPGWGAVCTRRTRLVAAAREWFRVVFMLRRSPFLQEKAHLVRWLSQRGRRRASSNRSSQNSRERHAGGGQAVAAAAATPATESSAARLGPDVVFMLGQEDSEDSLPSLAQEQVALQAHVFDDIHRAAAARLPVKAPPPAQGQEQAVTLVPVHAVRALAPCASEVLESE